MLGYLFTGRLSDTKKQGRRGRPSTRSGSAWLPTRGQSVPRAARPHAPHDLSTSRGRSKMPSLHGGRRRLSDMEREPPSRRGIGGGRRTSAGRPLCVIWCTIRRDSSHKARNLASTRLPHAVCAADGRLRMCGACAGGGADDLKVALLRALMLSNQSKHCYRRVRAAEGRKRGRKARRDARHHHGRCGPPAWARGWLKAAAAPADRRLRLARRRGSREGHVGYVFWAGGGQSRPCATVLRDLVGPSILSKSH